MLNDRFALIICSLLNSFNQQLPLTFPALDNLIIKAKYNILTNNKTIINYVNLLKLFKIDVKVRIRRKY